MILVLVLMHVLLPEISFGNGNATTSDMYLPSFLPDNDECM